MSTDDTVDVDRLEEIGDALRDAAYDVHMTLHNEGTPTAAARDHLGHTAHAWTDYRKATTPQEPPAPLTSAIRPFTREELDDLDLPDALRDVEEVEQRRWYTIRRGVVEVDGQFWSIQFCDPATEMQEVDPWYNQDTVTGVLVHRTLVPVEKWVPVGAPA